VILSRTALIYDFDGTLARGNVQEHSFLPELGIPTKEFWGRVKELARQHDSDEILTYMWHMLDLARSRGLTVTRHDLETHGRNTPLFAGLGTWFDRINEYGRLHRLGVEHYIISSGNREIIKGSSISGQFRDIYASKFIFSDSGEAVWPGVGINYTNKTQFLFRINKGVDNIWDNEAVNRWIPLRDRPVPFERMIFFGDGDTDIPAMKMVRHQGGYSIAVFDPAQWEDPRSQEKLHKLIAEDRVHFVAPADYREGSQLEVITKGILGRVALDLGYRE
jgi:phosphoserine phosphatase